MQCTNFLDLLFEYLIFSDFLNILYKFYVYFVFTLVFVAVEPASLVEDVSTTATSDRGKQNWGQTRSLLISSSSLLCY